MKKKTHRFISTMVVIGLGLLWPFAPEASAQSTSDSLAQVDVSDPEAFRDVMLKLITTLEEAIGREPRTSQAIREMSNEQVGLWHSYIEEPERFFVGAEIVLSHIEESRSRIAMGPGRSSGAVGAPFPPDYPPETGVYGVSIFVPLQALGLVDSADDRCDSQVFAGFWDAYVAGKVAAAVAGVAVRVADAACAVIACEPIGFACAIACAITEVATGVLETAVDALDLLEVPITLCAIQDGNVDGAEIEATYENSVNTLNDLAAHDTNIDGDLAAHDANIDGDLAAHDARMIGRMDTLDATLAIILANQEEIIRLLKTPQGKRPGWNRGGGG